jgi:hypothetical protein
MQDRGRFRPCSAYDWSGVSTSAQISRASVVAGFAVLPVCTGDIWTTVLLGETNQ